LMMTIPASVDRDQAKVIYLLLSIWPASQQLLGDLVSLKGSVVRGFTPGEW